MNPGTGMKSWKDVGRMGQRTEELRGYFRIFLLLYLPKQGCYHGNGMPEFYTRRSMRGSEPWPAGTGRDAIVPPAMSHFADPCLSKGVIRFPGRWSEPCTLGCLCGLTVTMGILQSWLGHIRQWGRGKTVGRGREQTPVSSPQQDTRPMSSSSKG